MSAANADGYTPPPDPIDQAIREAPSTPTAKRGADHQRTRCECKLPRVKHHENNVYLCARCGHRLNTDTRGNPYRRWPGDLDQAVIHEGRLKLVEMLPEKVRERLMRIASDTEFVREARKAVAKHQAIAASDPEQLMGPNARRRAARRAAALADTVDRLVDEHVAATAAVANDAIGTPQDKLDAFIRNVEQHRHGPEPEIISREEFQRRNNPKAETFPPAIEYDPKRDRFEDEPD